MPAATGALPHPAASSSWAPPASWAPPPPGSWAPPAPASWAPPPAASWAPAWAPDASPFAVLQRYEAYTEIEHQTWQRLLARSSDVVSRFGARLHPAYVAGLERLVLPWQRIPALDELSASLAEYGWRTLCVSGYLPPEIYAGLMASGVFPVSRDIRQEQHLEFSPTPDLAHDLIGHIPMLVSSEHRRFLQRLSWCLANTAPSELDRELFVAQQRLGAARVASPSRAPAGIPASIGSRSTTQTQPEGAATDEPALWLAQRTSAPRATPARAKASRARRAIEEDLTAERVSAAERRVADAERALAASPSLLCQLGRLYLWSIEFGLMGSCDDFAIYGAGLLSSPAETDALCSGRARVVPISPAVFRTNIRFSDLQDLYFVARDYEELHDLLDAVTQTDDAGSR